MNIVKEQNDSLKEYFEDVISSKLVETNSNKGINVSPKSNNTAYQWEGRFRTVPEGFRLTPLDTKVMFDLYFLVIMITPEKKEKYSK